MPVARSAHEVFDYVLLEERGLPAEKQTVFTLRRLTTRLHMRAQALASDLGLMSEFVLRVGIAGWRNFAEAGGTEVPCKHDKGDRVVHGITVRDPLSEESLDFVPIGITGELAQAIINGNTLTADDVKN